MTRCIRVEWWGCSGVGGGLAKNYLTSHEPCILHVHVPFWILGITNLCKWQLTVTPVSRFMKFHQHKTTLWFYHTATASLIILFMKEDQHRLTPIITVRIQSKKIIISTIRKLNFSFVSYYLHRLHKRNHYPQWDRWTVMWCTERSRKQHVNWYSNPKNPINPLIHFLNYPTQECGNAKPSARLQIKP